MKKHNSLIIFLGLFFIGIFFSGCALSYTIKEPVLSNMDYEIKDIKPINLNIIDKRTEMDSIFLVGKIGAFSPMKDISNLLKLENIENPLEYFSVQLEKELNSRGIPVKCVIVTTQTEELTLQINRYQIANYRATGFSPWEACHLFSGAVINKGTETPIKAYFYNGKVPIISMNEIKDPCFNTPMSILIKDVASKMNKAVFNLKAPDEKIEALRTEIDSEMENKDVGPFWKILELGYTNNPNAVQPLKKYAQVGDEFSKSCALSAIGILSPHGQLEFLKQRLSEGGYNERYMAIKALGDIGTPEAMQVIQDMKNEQAYTNEGGLKSCVDLYAP